MTVALTQIDKINRIAIIGRKGHAKRIINVLNKNKRIKEIGIYHPSTKNFSTGKMTYFKNFGKLFNYSKIIISSPNHTHEKYLKKLFYFKGDILCEKPAFSLNNKSLILKKYQKKKKCNLTINYNFLHSEFFDYLSKFLKNKKYGKKISLFIKKSNSLSLSKKKYLGNWRSDKKLSIGIVEIQTVHYINMLINLFGSIKLQNKFTSKISNFKNTPIDTLNYTFSKKDFLMNIFNSYATVYDVQFELYTSKAKFIYDGKNIKIFFPSNNTGINGRFTYPVLLKQKKIDFEKDWKRSLAKSINFFINRSTSNKKKKFNLNEAIETIKLI